MKSAGMTRRPREQVVRRHAPPLVLLCGLHRDAIEPMLGLAREWGWELRGTWISSDDWPDNRPFAGALLAGLPTASLARQLSEAGCPAVRFGALPHPGDSELPAVLPDLAAAGRLAAEHFATRNFRQVAYAGYDPENPDANTHAMYVAFRDRAGELGMGAHLLSTRSPTNEKNPAREASRAARVAGWLRGLPKPIGVFAFNDIMAERIALACVKVGLTIPEDVALLGYGNSLQCEIMPVRLSSVDPGLGHRIQVAMHLLHDLMNGRAAPRQPIMVPPAGIVERRSTSVLAVNDAKVAKALRFLWDHFAEDLSVDDVARATGVNRRALERGFRRELQRGVRDELRRRRLDVACERLRTTDDSVAAIAAGIGYRSTQYLHRAFLAAYAMTPRKYRLAVRAEPKDHGDA